MKRTGIKTNAINKNKLVVGMKTSTILYSDRKITLLKKHAMYMVNKSAICLIITDQINFFEPITSRVDIIFNNFTSMAVFILLICDIFISIS